jgi:RNA polymerase sigma-70 factor (ECF subfamily)
MAVDAGGGGKGPIEMPQRDIEDAPTQAVVDYAVNHVRQCVRALRVPEADRDDVAQEVLIKVLRRAHTYDPQRPLPPWLVTIAYRTARDHRRRACRWREVPSEIHVDAGPDPRPGADERMAKADEARRVAEVLAAITPDRRRVLVRAEQEDASMAEIAGELGITTDAGYNRLSRARAEFRDLWTRSSAR